MRLRAFTLIELLSAMGIVAVLAMMVLAGVKASREKAQSVICASQLRQWALAMMAYAQDNDGYLPRRGQGVQAVFVIDRPDDWFNCLPPYMEMPSYNELYQSGRAPKPRDHSVFVCPSAVDTGSYSHFICYGMNIYVSRWDKPERMKFSKLPNPSIVAFMADSVGGYASTAPSSSGYTVIARHGGRANVSFFDGHVSSFRGDYLGCGTGEKTQPDVRWNPGFEDDVWKPGP